MVTQFEFLGVEERGQFMFAKVHLLIDTESADIGCINVTISVPLDSRDRALSELRQESLALAQRSILVQPLLEWAQSQEALPADPSAK